MFGFLDDLLKDPTAMAILGGAAIAATGGAAAPAVLGAESAAAGAATAATAAGTAGAAAGAGAGAAAAGAGAAELGTGLMAFNPAVDSQLANMAIGPSALSGYTGGTGLMGTLKEAASYAKPVGQAIGAASAAKGLLAPDQAPVQGAPVTTGQGGPQGLNALYQQIQQGDLQRQQEQMQKRMKRQSMYGGM